MLNPIEMKLLQQTTILFLGLALTGCMKSNYQVNGNKGVQPSDELKGYAFARENSSAKPWTSLEVAVHKDLQAKNYFYDNINPDVLVFVEELPKGVKLLSGNTYQDGSERKYETGKIKTKGKTGTLYII